MSNGLTSVVVAVLAMATSAEANTDTERRLALQIASRDQSVSGRGTVGFALDQLSWPTGNEESFESAKEFALRSINRAKSGQDWGRLDYTPHHDWVQSRLHQLAEMVDQLDFPTIRASTAQPIEVPIPSDHPAWCGEHEVFEHLHGCVICNDR